MPRLSDRLSLPFVRSHSQTSAVSLELSSSNPDVTLHGSAEEGIGVLISGQVTLDVHEDNAYITRLVAELNLHITLKRPFKSHCNRCRNQNSQLNSWQLLTQPTTLSRGKHTFPFSVPLDGHHPASMENPLISVKYELRAEAQFARSGGASLETTKNERLIIVKRALPVPNTPQCSVRTVNPIRISAYYSPAIHPNSINKFTFELKGLKTIDSKTGISQAWKLSQVTWHLIEATKLAAPACKKHRSVTTADGNLSQVMRITDFQVLGKGQMQDGWTSNGSGVDAKANMEFEYTTNSQRSKSHGLKYACDNKWLGGAEITHHLVLWFYLSLEEEPQSKVRSKHSAGYDRILRLTFDVAITDYPDKDMNWGTEVPPMYGDVGGGPPGYQLGEPVEYESLGIDDEQRPISLP